MAAMTALAIIALASSAYSAYEKHKAGSEAKKIGEAQGSAAESEAQLSDYNAEVASLQADDAIARGTEDENRFRAQIRGTIGAQRAGFAGAGVDVGFGSAVDVQADAAYLGELDALTIRSNAAREAWGFNVQAEDLTRRAAITRKEGKNAVEAGKVQQRTANIDAAAGVLQTGGSLLQQKYGMSNSTKRTNKAPGGG